MDERQDFFRNEQPEERGYIPKYEKTPEEENAPTGVPYDEFMFEPIGFETHEQNGGASNGGNTPSPQKPQKSTRAAIILFVVLLLGAMAFAAYGIIKDILFSRESINKLLEQKKVVIYQERKPEGSDAALEKDENGKYSIEGAAQLVKPSIVEIHTYEDAIQKTFGNHIGSGSGIVITEDGFIVTNAHVLRADGVHTVTSVEGKVYDAKIVGRDSKTDIAVIKVEGAKLTPATLGDSDEAIVGEQVLAIGNPASLSFTVTDGIISAVNRHISSDETSFEMNCIQTNADISPGNSGGALINLYGQVIGITSSKYVSSSYEGLGFAITINEALPIIEELMSQGYVGGRFRIGIQLIDMSSQQHITAIEKELGFKLPQNFTGIYIDTISDDSDIKNTDLKPGDFITEINGKAVKTYDEFYDTISSMYGAGDTVPATCAHISEKGKVSYYKIKFKLLEDTSGDY